MKNINLKISAIILIVVFISCKKNEEAKPSVESLKQSAVENYSNIVYASYTDSYNKAVELQTAINTFIVNPTENTLAEAKQTWLDARIPYLQTEVYRFYGGPIDNTDGPEGLINAWPMDESYLDYTSTETNSGIINNPTKYPTIDKNLVITLNQDGGETNISTGYHAIEFLLWGQDLSTTSAGQRPYTDYLSTGGTASNQSRRADYLKVCADLLVENLAYLVNQWKPNTNNYRATFETNSNDSFKKILLGMGSLAKGELSGQRMLVAYDTRAQEDEHSCFSDNTHFDIVYNAQGINNIYFGKYTKSDGTTIDGIGINDVINSVDTNLDNKIQSQLTTTIETTKAIRPPFDQEINNEDGRTRVLTAIKSIDAEADIIVEIASALGITLLIN